MSTRANIRVIEGSGKNNWETVQLYRHCDGYPEAMIPTIKEAWKLTDEGKTDIGTIRPLVFSPELREYHGIGEFVGTAFEIGKK